MRDVIAKTERPLLSFGRRRSVSVNPIGLNEWAQWMTFQGNQYPFSYANANTTYGANKQEEPDNNFAGYVRYFYRSNGPVFALELVRMLIFSDARFQWRRLRDGRPQDLFGNQDLALLERPWTNGTTSDLLKRMILDADLAGNFYATEINGQVKRMRPDWVTIVLGSEQDADVTADDLEAEVLGYIYRPGGRYSGKDAVVLLPERVAHFAPIPDPLACYRGMSWLTPVIRETMADQAAMGHKLQFFENGATPNLVVKMDPQLKPEDFELWTEVFRDNHEGWANAYKTIFLGGGADATVVGANMEQIQFKVTQGHGETRLAAAAGVPPVIVGFSEGLDAATYSNYAQARRRLADGTLRPLWRDASGSLETLLRRPADAQLWYDDRDIAFLREDAADNAKIQQTRAATLQTLISAGFDPDSAVAAVLNDDYSRLTHTGLTSVQLHEPGAGSNGAGDASAVPAPT